MLRHALVQPLVSELGREFIVTETRRAIDALRGDTAGLAQFSTRDECMETLAQGIQQQVREKLQPSLKPVFNLTGTILHTNLGRAILPECAIEAVAAVSRGASNLEYDLAAAKRGDRDSHIENMICELTGAEAATVVNNNAAAVLLVLNSFALHREVIVSRGELVEIGGSFRIPDVMARAGCTLREVGTTNRTHLHDFQQAMGPDTGLVMKVHTSNYEISGFTSSVPEKDLAALTKQHNIPFAVDLGSGSLVDLQDYGLPHEPTPQETLANGADVVTFSGDKILGGPQCGLIIGTRQLVAQIRKNPLKRALRVDKMTLAALNEVLKLYLNREHVAETVPTLRFFTRPLKEIKALANSLVKPVAKSLGKPWQVSTVPCHSQIGSGALPRDLLPSHALAIQPAATNTNASIKRLADAFLALPVPVVGRISDNTLIFDARCLLDQEKFIRQLSYLQA
jgi:L-seryl-tRNA(Ser) seleniumtransferase